MEYKYLGQCDRLRINEENETKFQNMLKDKVETNVSTFIERCNLSPLCEEQTPLEYINDCLNADHETKVFFSNWGKDECMFLQTHGFEFIFTKLIISNL